MGDIEDYLECLKIHQGNRYSSSGSDSSECSDTDEIYDLLKPVPIPADEIRQKAIYRPLSPKGIEKNEHLSSALSSQVNQDKSKTEIMNMKKVKKDAKCKGENIFGGITKQIILGTSSGWITGFMMMKIGTSTALVFRSGVLLLQLANEKSYIDMSWDKINKVIDEEIATKHKQLNFNRIERFVERKFIKSEDILKNKEKRWYSGLLGDDEYRLKDFHMFAVSFVVGFAIGVTIC